MELAELLLRKVSFQKNAWSQIEGEISIKQCLEMIKACTLQQEIKTLREYLSQNEVEKYDLHKKRLPGVTFSSTFYGSRKSVSIKDYNSLLVIDIDKLDNHEMVRVKEVLLNDDYIFCFWESPSKRGIKGLIHITYDILIDKAQFHIAHKLAFKGISEYLWRLYSIKIDQSGSDITRLCFLSADSHLQIKTNLCPFEVRTNDIENVTSEEDSAENHKKDEVKIRVPKSRFLNPKGKNLPQNRNTMKSIIKYLSKRHLSITPDYEKWYRVAYAIANTFTIDIGEKYYLTLCRLDGALHDEEQSKYLLNYSYENSKGEITFSTIVYLAKQLGYKDKGGTEGA